MHGSKSIENPLASDLNHILDHTRDLWDELRGQRLFITGGTGFFGCWLLESFAWANDKLNLDASALVLTRDPDAFRRKAPHLASHPAIKYQRGDILSFEFQVGEFSYIIHAATESDARRNEENPIRMFESIVFGTSRILNFAKLRGTRKILLTSSGAVYGRQPPELMNIPEDYPTAPNSQDTRSAYGEAKRAAELLFVLYANQYGFDAKIARCFAFVGPYLPLDLHYAIGNFIRDGMAGGPLEVKGDGTPYRSYLYAADLSIWLWTILVNGQNGRPYNVGSEHGIPISQVAYQVADCFDPAPLVQIAKDAQRQKPPERYVPKTQRAREELHLGQNLKLSESIRKTIDWYTRKNQ